MLLVLRRDAYYSIGRGFPCLHRNQSDTEASADIPNGLGRSLDINVFESAGGSYCTISTVRPQGVLGPGPETSVLCDV